MAQVPSPSMGEGQGEGEMGQKGGAITAHHPESPQSQFKNQHPPFLQSLKSFKSGFRQQRT